MPGLKIENSNCELVTAQVDHPRDDVCIHK
jgi:hypothetical protein